MSRQWFLPELGRRLRAARERADLSVSALARKAEVSRRYITQAEAGEANLSALKLFELAQALGVPLRELVDIAPRANRGERIALVGLRGAGKSTVGRRLALELEVPFVELDGRASEIAGMTLAEIFQVHGEEHFHRLEAEALEQVLSEGERVVIAAGGSIVASPANFARLRESCRTVWLKADPIDHFTRVLDQGDRRPMRDRPRAMTELESILATREPLYAECEIVIETSGKSTDEVLASVQRSLSRRAGRDRAS
jgi:XRE family aerobic/anaerobic benzoate catabolism transcriptional regulator